MYVHNYLDSLDADTKQNITNAWSTIIRGIASTPLQPLSRDEAVARLHGRQVIDLERAGRRRRTLEAAIVIGHSTREG